MAGSRDRVDLNQLSLPELQNFYEQLSSEVQTFTNNMVALQQTANRFATAGQSVEQLKEKKKGQPVLLPMTESMYVAGTLESVDTVLLEIGTGYYVEKDIDGGVDYCRRKVMLVKDKVEQLAQIIQTRQQALTQIQTIAAERSAAAS